MGSFRQGAAHSNVQTPLLIIGGLLLLGMLLAIFQQQLRKRKRKQYHAALELQSSGVVGQIHRRKDDLNRFIAKLRTQLAVREQQLQIHDELEGIVTARVETARKQDNEWDEIMSAGKKLHGKKWTQAPADGQPSLKELMELHRDELLELKATMASGARSGRGKREKRQATRPSAQVMQLPQDVELHASPRSAPPQWQSTRRTAGSLIKSVKGPESHLSELIALDTNCWSKNNFHPAASDGGTGIVPKLDLAKLSTAADLTSSSKTPFKEKFQRQAKLASSLKLKKKKKS